VRGLGVQIADGVIADRREVDDRVESGEVPALDVADVGSQRIHLADALAEDARLEEVRVKADDIVPRLFEDRDEHRADIAVVTSDEYAQGTSRSPTDDDGSSP